MTQIGLFVGGVVVSFILMACVACFYPDTEMMFDEPDPDSDEMSWESLMMWTVFFKTLNLTTDWGFALTATDCGGDCSGLADAALAFAIIGTLLWLVDVVGVYKRFDEEYVDNAAMPKFSQAAVCTVLFLQDVPMFVLNCHHSNTAGATFTSVVGILVSAGSILWTLKLFFCSVLSEDSGFSARAV